ncbi:MAG TPA: glycosyltransferase family 2 protein, partial [Chthoniobacteraceae bacterium]
MTGCAIIIPAFNAAAYLAEAIESTLRQTAPASSITVVDDGSTDATPEICTRFGDAVTLLRQPNQGVSVARNFGASQVRAEWLLFLDADDRLLPVALEKMLARAAQGSFGVLYGQSIHFDESTGKRWTHGVGGCEGTPPAAAVASFWKSPVTTPGGALVRAEVFREIGGFNPLVNSLADRDLWMKAGVAHSFGFIPEPVIEKRAHGENMSSNLDRALYQTAFVQFGFLDWCRERGVDPKFLRVSPQAIIDNVVNKALEGRRLGAIAQISELAGQRGVETTLLRQARGYLSMAPSAAQFRLR